MTYELFTSETGVEFIKRINDDGSVSFIPKDLANSEYQIYLRWLENPEAEQSTPNLAD